MENKTKQNTEKLLCPKACVLNQLDDDRHSDTIVLETQKAIDATFAMLTRDGLKINNVSKQDIDL